jgi:hypothetical protein
LPRWTLFRCCCSSLLLPLLYDCHCRLRQLVAVVYGSWSPSSTAACRRRLLQLVAVVYA